ncbi:MAG: 2-isopropylmalate synthase [Acidobacteriaceae bacterium]
MHQERIFFFDTTLRDGEQSPGCSMYMAEKVRMAKQLELLGVDVIEAGFAIASDGDFAAVRQVAQEVKGPRICSLSRAKEEDIVAAARALEPADKPRIHIFLASSDIHLEYKLQISREQALELTDKSVRLARTYVDDVEFSPEDASRSDREFLCEMVQIAVDAGATVINLPDTVGYTVPHEYASMFRLMKERIRGVENIVLSSHCHNDLGLAVANSLAALEAGARQVECTINGIGERAGNAALEELAAAMYVRHDQLPFQHNLDLKQLFPASQMLSEVITFAPAPNKAVVGSNAFSHEAGIHQHGMMSNPLCYEIMTPSQVGVPANKMVLGKHSGRHALNHRLKELGFSLSRADLDLAYQRFVEVADRKKSVFDQDLVSIMLTHLRQSPVVNQNGGQHGSGGSSAVAAPRL